MPSPSQMSKEIKQGSALRVTSHITLKLPEGASYRPRSEKRARVYKQRRQRALHLQTEGGKPLVAD